VASSCNNYYNLYLPKYSYPCFKYVYVMYAFAGEVALITRVYVYYGVRFMTFTVLGFYAVNDASAY